MDQMLFIELQGKIKNIVSFLS